MSSSKQVFISSAAIIVFFAGLLAYNLTPVGAANTATNASSSTVVFEVKHGDGVREIAANLGVVSLIRSPLAFESFAFLDGTARTLQPGLYKLNPSMSVPAIIGAMASVQEKEVTVTIPEGSNIYGIDDILSSALVIHPGALIAFNRASNINTTSTLEGKLFPDTYQFYSDSDVHTVVQKFLDNFNAKAAQLFVSPSGATTTASVANEEKILIIASMLEKEVPSSTDQAIVAGIINKRLAAGIPLDIDATICYAKTLADPEATGPCSLSAADLKLDSPYNTYLYRGLPPGPIGNPGLAAIQAALNPKTSPYLYYLTDPKTGQTIYAATLAQQEANQAKYLQ